MTHAISSIRWQDTAEADAPISNTLVDFASDLDWQFQLSGAYHGTQIFPTGVVIDNSGSQAPISVKYGATTQTVPPFQRASVVFPKGSGALELASPAAVQVPIQFYITGPVPDLLSAFASQLASNQQGALAVAAGTYVLDTGAANAIAGAVTPIPSAQSDLIGLPLRILIGHANTGAVTIAINPFAALPLVHPDGTPMLGGELAAGGVASVVFDGVRYQLVGPAHPPASTAALAAAVVVAANEAGTAQGTANAANTGAAQALAFQARFTLINPVAGVWQAIIPIDATGGIRFQSGSAGLPTIPGGGTSITFPLTLAFPRVGILAIATFSGAAGAASCGAFLPDRANITVGIFSPFAVAGVTWLAWGA